MRDLTSESVQNSTNTTSEKIPLPPILEDKLNDMKLSSDYQNSVIPTSLYDEFSSLGETFEDFVWISQNRKEDICNCAGANIDVTELLNRDWQKATELKILRYFDGKVIFPISISRKDDKKLVEISIRRNTLDDVQDPKPWFVNYVDSYVVKQKSIAGRALNDWAYLGDSGDVLEELAEKALPEKWDTDKEGDKTYPILWNYLTYTFYRLQSEGKVLENRDKEKPQRVLGLRWLVICLEALV